MKAVMRQLYIVVRGRLGYDVYGSMSAVASFERQKPGVAQQISTRAAFFIAGIAMGAWAPLVPYAKTRASLDEATLGLLLLCLGMGSIVTMPLTGILAGRFGCRIVLTVASLVIGVVLPLLAILDSAPLLAPAIFLLGAGVGTVDVAVNIQAIEVEKAAGRPMMSGFHGLYSVGGIVGAAGMAGLLGLKFAPSVAILFASGIIVLLLGLFAKDFLPYGTDSHTQLWAPPHGKVLLIGVLCFIMFLAEGSMLDWSALFLEEQRDVARAQAGLGYAVFAIAMTLGRLNGDRIVTSLGSKKVLLLGGLCAAIGLILAVAIPVWWLSLAGFALVGIGASNIVPVLFTQAGRQSVMPANLAISTITTLGYLGILAGPAMIGFIAHATSLSLSLLLVALSMLAIPATVRAVASND